MTSSSGNVPLTAARVHEVRLTNDDLFWRQPNVHGVGEGYFRNTNGTWSTTYGISIYVTQATDQSTLPSADRIPSLIERVPVRLVVCPELSFAGAIGHGEHRPVDAGVRVISSRKKTKDNPVTTDVDEGGIPFTGNTGTLTGLVTRNTDGKKFVVTNQHVLCGDVRTSPAGHEELYQQTIAEDTRRLDVNKRIGGGDGLAKGMAVTETGTNTADVAMCSHDPDAEIGFLLHGHGSNSGRRVIPGTIDPVFDEDTLAYSPTELLMVGASGGAGLVDVRGVNQTRVVSKGKGADKVNMTFTGLIILDCTGRLAQEGDSGAPCLADMGDDEYKMVGIFFARELEVDDEGRDVGSHVGYAFPASVAEAGLEVQFGNKPPVAVIRAPDRVARNQRRVELNGSDSYDPDNNTITYLWTQENTTGPQVTIVNSTSFKAYFDAPDFIPSRVIFKLTVKDSKGDTGEAYVTIEVGPAFPSSPPTSIPEPDPEPEPPPQPVWEYTGETDGCGSSFRRERRRGSVTEWESDPQPDPWGPWSDTGRYISSGQHRQQQQVRTSSCGHTDYGSRSDPEEEVWPDTWTDTGRYEYIDAYTYFKEQSRTSSYGNTQTRWVAG